MIKVHLNQVQADEEVMVPDIADLDLYVVDTKPMLKTFSYNKKYTTKKGIASWSRVDLNPKGKSCCIRGVKQGPV